MTQVCYELPERGGTFSRTWLIQTCNSFLSSAKLSMAKMPGTALQLEYAI